MWGFLKVRVGSLSEVVGRGVRGKHRRRLGGLRRSNPRGFRVRVVLSGIFRRMREGFGGVVHPWEVGAPSR